MHARVPNQNKNNPLRCTHACRTKTKPTHFDARVPNQNKSKHAISRRIKVDEVGALHDEGDGEVQVRA